MADYAALYPLAVQATGPVDSEAEWQHKMRQNIVKIAIHQAEMVQFAETISKAMERDSNGRPAHKGWGVINGTVTNVYIDKERAERCFIEYKAWSTRAGGFVDESIRTEPTNSDPHALAIYNQASALVGHKVRMFKRPDASAPGDNVPKILFHIMDEGLAEGDGQQGGQQGGGQNRQRQAPQNAQQAPQQEPENDDQERSAGPQTTIQADDAKRRLFLAVHKAVPEADQATCKRMCADAWNNVDGLGDAPEVTTTALDAAVDYAANSHAAGVYEPQPQN